MLKINFKIPKVLQNPLFIKLLWEIQGVTINTIDVPKNAQFSCWKQLKSWKSLVDLLLNNCNTLILRLKLRNNFFKNIAFTFASDAAMLIGWKHLAMLDVITHCQQCFFKTIAGCDRQSMRTHCIYPCLYGLTVREPAIN